MSQAFDRGIVLFQQGRYEMASQQFRGGLAEEPEDANGHAFLALCLVEVKQKDEALREADEAVRLDPGSAFIHYTRGRVLLDHQRLRESAEAVREAIALDPYDADYRGLLASIELARHRRAEALEAAEAGLAIDPEHSACMNLRAMALTQLGRRAEAAATLGSALAGDPENAVTHANQGWSYLHESDPKKAIEHFREALRLDPELEWARVGMIEALKARHLFYRLMLRFFLWMGRQSTRAQWILILAFVFGRSALTQLKRQHPELSGLIEPILIGTLAFVLLTWIASPLFNFLLQFNRFGRLALSRDQKVAANLIGVSATLAAIGAVAFLFDHHDKAYVTMNVFGFLLLPLAVTFQQQPGRSRAIMGAVTAGIAILSLPALGYAFLGARSPFGGFERAVECLNYVVLGCVVSSWIPALMGLRAVTR
jgi:tetratricopeptide (TPR) repeat protein